MCSLTNVDFPTVDLLPKKDTGVLNFLSKFPEYDGRGIVIAVLDSGVDPNADGLQVTTDGKPKIIERYDCSGAGDIDTSTIAIAENGTIKGLSGRTLHIPEKWRNPSGRFRIGIRNAYDLVNKYVKERVSKERKEKLWDNHHKSVYAKCSNSALQYNKEINSESKKSCSRFSRLEKEDIDSQIEALDLLEKKFCDPGPVYDFVLFHDGIQWWAVMDTSETGDLKSCDLLTEFSVDPKSFSTFPGKHCFTYSFNVHDDGNVLELVGCASGHGTHVASIAAAHFPEDPSKNGVAPGAQIISLTIGNQRLDTMETGSAIIRAMIYIMQRCRDNKKVHVINMSYGEFAHFADSGRLAGLMNEVIDKYGVVWVVSAGNNGPGLFTVGTPPSITTTNIIGVGAFVSPEMMAAEYSLREKLPATLYSWSSRGPTMDGDRGISICAPGAAIASVPIYFHQSSDLYNGTSMASPHVAGAVALLASGLEDRKIPYTPYFMKRMLENSAKFSEYFDYFAQGHGLLQIEKAFNYLTSYYNCKESQVRFHITCGGTSDKGIIIRKNNVTNTSITVQPVFFNSDDIDPSIKINFALNLILSCDSPWIQIPQYLAIMNSSRSFSVRIDPTGLIGSIHNSTIRAYDSENLDKGPVFCAEVTVIKPQTIDVLSLKPFIDFKNVVFGPNTIKRHFIMVPDNVSWAEITVESSTLLKSKSGRFMVHCTQIVPRKNCNTYKYKKIFQLFDCNETPFSFPVLTGVILEVVLAKFWSSLDEHTLNYTIKFAGNKPKFSEFVMFHFAQPLRIDLEPSWITEEVQCSAQLKNLVTILNPTESVISPLNNSHRDIIPPSRIIYQLLLSYNFQISKSVEITLTNPILNEFLYESDYESQLWMLYDSNKRYIASGDAYPNEYSVKLEKGDFIVRHQIRHESKELLEKLSNVNLLLNQKLPNSITLDSYRSLHTAVIGEKLKTLTIIGNSHVHSIYLGPTSNDKLPKSICAGQFLTGSIVFSRDRAGKKIDTYPLKYLFSDVSKKSPKSSSDRPEKQKDDDCNDAYKNFLTSLISKSAEVDAIRFYEIMKTQFKDHLASHVAMLQMLEPESRRYFPGFPNNAPTSDYLLRVINIADEVISRVDEKALLASLGSKSDNSDEAAKKAKSVNETKRDVLVEALGRKGCALSQYYLLHNDHQPESAIDDAKKITLEGIDELWLSLIKYINPDDVMASHCFAIWHAAAFAHYGRLVKLLLKFSEERSVRDVDASLKWAFEKLNWEHCCRFYNDKLLVNYPQKYQLF